jgi:hypothetical protein
MRKPGAENDQKQAQNVPKPAENDIIQAQNDSKPDAKPARKRGPKTKRGKDAAARRSTKHGVLARNPVIPGMERKRDWDAHLEGVIEALQPEGHVERKLAYRVALAVWQLERLDRYVTAVSAGSIDDAAGGGEILIHGEAHPLFELIIESGGRSPGRPEPTPEERAQKREQRIIPQTSELKKIIRYEAHLHRLIDKTLRILEALQAKRLGHKVYHVRHL